MPLASYGTSPAGVACAIHKLAPQSHPASIGLRPEAGRLSGLPPIIRAFNGVAHDAAAHARDQRLSG
eukprot:9513813-Alexandrium_andersonii.AAC.1